MNEIYILSGDKRSGKTNTLKKWCENKPHMGGILTPNKDGQRVFLDLSDNQEFPMLASQDEIEVLEVGRFKFSKKSFDRAVQSIYRSIDQKKEWIIIDEIGPLELRNEGFADLLRYMLLSTGMNYKIMLVVREGLLEKVITYFGIQSSGVKIVEKDDKIFE